MFPAGNAVHLGREATAAAVTGVGTGNVAEHLGALRDAGVTLHLSGMSSKARAGSTPARGAELYPPAKLVELVAWADTALTY